MGTVNLFISRVAKTLKNRYDSVQEFTNLEAEIYPRLKVRL